MIEEGKYKAKRSSHQFMVSSKKGTEYVSVVFRISEGQDFAGKRVEWAGWLSPAAIDRTLEALRLMGWDGKDLRELGPLDQEVEIDVEIEDDEQGNTRERVKWVNEIGRSNMGAPMSPDQLAGLAERVKARASGGGSSAGGGEGEPRYDRNGNRVPF